MYRIGWDPRRQNKRQNCHSKWLIKECWVMRRPCEDMALVRWSEQDEGHSARNGGKWSPPGGTGDRRCSGPPGGMGVRRCSGPPGEPWGWWKEGPGGAVSCRAEWPSPPRDLAGKSRPSWHPPGLLSPAAGLVPSQPLPGEPPGNPGRLWGGRGDGGEDVETEKQVEKGGGRIWQRKVSSPKAS